MDLLNFTRFATDRFIGMGGDGFEHLAVVVKATFGIARNGLTLLDEQPPIRTADEYHGDPATSSIAAAAETAPFKPGTDVLVAGCAYPPPGRHTEALVSVQLARLRKTFKAVGDRIWERRLLGMQATPPAPFIKMPILYERTYGGTDDSNPHAKDRLAANPVGVGFRAKRSRRPTEGSPLPNLEELGDPMKSPTQILQPMGLGPIAPSWSPRPEFAGTYDSTWMTERMPLLPDDFDPRFFQVAPPDQVVQGHIRGEEAVEILGMRPEGALRFALPRVRPEVVVKLGTSRLLPPCACDTVAIDCEKLQVSLVWRARQVVHGRVPDLRWIKVTAVES
jgi:hypothetical protein